jgi:hypothetical protein
VQGFSDASAYSCVINACLFFGTNWFILMTSCNKSCDVSTSELQKLPRIRWYNLQGLLFLIKKYTFYCLRDAVRRKFPEKWGTNSCFLLHECPSTPDGFSQKFLSKEHCENTGTSPYSHDVAAVDFYLFPRLILAFKGRCFCDATDVIKNAMEELKKAFTAWLPGKFPTPLQSLAEVCSCTR